MGKLFGTFSTTAVVYLRLNNLFSMRLLGSTNKLFPNNLIENSGNKKRKKIFIKQLKMSASINPIKRIWTQSFSNNSIASKEFFPFTLMSYNVLAQDLIEIHPEYYNCHNPEALKWSQRFQLFLMEVASIQPHILCLQEVQKSHLDQFVDALSGVNLCKSVYKKRTGDQTDGCAIFFNSNIFRLIEEQTVEYYQPTVQVLDRQNVGIIVKLSLNKHPESMIVVATTHLLYNPRRQDVRLAQIQVLLAELDRISHNGEDINGRIKYLPTLLAGDLNLQPNSAPYRLLKYGKLKYKNLTKSRLESSEYFPYYPITGDILIPKKLAISDYCQHVKFPTETQTQLYHSENPDISTPIPVPDLSKYQFESGTLQHRLNLWPVYDGLDYVSMFQYEWILVDYIFYSKTSSNINDNKLKLISYYQLPTKRIADTFGLIPNNTLASDHLSIAAKFLLFFNQQI